MRAEPLAPPWAAAWPSLLPAMLLVLLLGYWLLGLGAAPLFDVDEGAFAEASREMLASGDWGHTTLNGTDRFDKPILVYWLQAGSLALFGASEFAVRLPSALCAVGLGLLLAFEARRRLGGAAVWLAPLLMATALGPWIIGRAATADALLHLLLALSLVDLSRALLDGNVPARRRFALWMGLGLLAKGPVAVVLPAGALLLWAMASGRAGWLRLLHLLRDGWAWLILLLVAAPWYVYALQRHGMAFVEGFLLRHNLERFSGPLEGHGGSLVYYLLALPLLVWPWAPLLVSGLLRGLRERSRLWVTYRQRDRREPLGFDALWAAWGLWVLLLFSLSGTKLPHYLLYGFVPLIWMLTRLLTQGLSMRLFAALLGCMALSLLLGASSPWWMQLLAQRLGDVHAQALLDLTAMSAMPLPGLALGALALVGLLAARQAAWRLPLLAGAALATQLSLSLQVLPWWGEAVQGPVRALSQAAAERQLPLVQWRTHQPSSGFYRAQAAPRRLPQLGEAALLRSDHLAALRQTLPAPQTARTLVQARGFVLVLVEQQP